MSREQEAWIVVDLGFGDAGKGSITDFLVGDREADLVVRFNGGAQAGHNVVDADGRHHTFSQFCAGSFHPGVRGLLGPDFLLHPLGMAVEGEHLTRLGLPDPWSRTAVDGRARLITPFQQAAGRIREFLRESNAHGSCGVGIGECVRDSIEAPDDTLHAADLGNKPLLRKHLTEQRERKREELRALPGARSDAAVQELKLFEDGQLIERVLTAWTALSERLWIVDERACRDLLTQSRRTVFEGAQGILLDQDWGFHPHTTWSDCSPAGAEALLPSDRPVLRLGVSRAYTVRHGQGPFPTESQGPWLAEDHNEDGGWQGAFRTGPLDAVLLRYALRVAGGVDGLVLTCLDRVGEAVPVCDGYEGEASGVLAERDAQGLIRSLVPGDREDLGHRERLGELLRQVRPVTREVDDPIAFVEAALDCSVLLESRGPRAGDKRWLQRASWTESSSGS